MTRKCFTLFILFVFSTHICHAQNNCVEAIVTQYFFPGIMIIIIDANLRISYPVIYQNSSVEHLTVFEFRHPDMYIVTLKGDVKRLLESLKTIDMFNSRAKFVILTDTSTYGEIFERLSEYFIYNVIVVDPEGNLATYHPFIYEDAMASDVQPTILGNCATLNFSRLDILDTQLPMLWRNTTVLSTYVEHFPYIYLNNGTLVGENYQVLQILKEKLQFQLRIDNAFESNTTNCTDVLDLLQDGVKHVVINHRTTPLTKLTKFDLALTNLAAHFYWIVPKGHHLSYGRILFQNFDLVVWFTILFVLLLLSFIWHYLEQRDWISSFLLHYQLLFESGNLNIVKISKLPTRIMTCASLFSFLVTSSTFRREMLRSFTTYSYEYPIDSAEDIVRNNLSCYASDDLKNVYRLLDGFYAKYIEQCVTIEEDDDQQNLLLKIAFQQNVAVISRELKVRFALNTLLIMGHEEPLIHMIHRQVKFDFLYIHLTRGYPLYDRFVQVIGRMHSAGFGSYFRHRVNYKVDRTFKSRAIIRSKNLTIEHISIAFYVIFVGLAVSAVVFLLEVAMKHIKHFNQ